VRYKDNLAVANVERGRRYTFPEYHRLTNRIANMCRDRLGLRHGGTAMLVLDNDNFSLVHLPAILKQEAAFVFGNLRDGPEESARQIDYVGAKAVFIETRMLAAYHDLLKSRGCTIVAMDREPGLPDDILCFWDLLEAASDADNDVELDLREHIVRLHFTSGTTGQSKCGMYTPDQRQLLHSPGLQPGRDDTLSGTGAAVARQQHAVSRVVLYRRRDLHAKHAGSRSVVQDRAGGAHHTRSACSYASLAVARYEQHRGL
jgi:acyl-CoA synthetase (AMP-forming)/AMP-acid ligase II